jgi:hypothetical protein
VNGNKGSLHFDDFPRLLNRPWNPGREPLGRRGPVVALSHSKARHVKRRLLNTTSPGKSRPASPCSARLKQERKPYALRNTIDEHEQRVIIGKPKYIAAQLTSGCDCHIICNSSLFCETEICHPTVEDLRVDCTHRCNTVTHKHFLSRKSHLFDVEQSSSPSNLNI